MAAPGTEHREGSIAVSTVLSRVHLHSGFKAQVQGNSRNHGLKDPHVYVVFWAHTCTRPQTHLRRGELPRLLSTCWRYVEAASS